jgi:hypothetical protein
VRKAENASVLSSIADRRALCFRLGYQHMK